MALLLPGLPKSVEGWGRKTAEISKPFSEEEIKVAIWGLGRKKHRVLITFLFSSSEIGNHQTYKEIA